MGMHFAWEESEIHFRWETITDETIWKTYECTRILWRIFPMQELLSHGYSRF
jgi:hypothetical protein